jgi:hypothetical protein
MDLRQRNHQDESRPETNPPEGSGPGAGEAASLQQQSAQFLETAHQILNAALSGNSQAFLAASRQQGGQ